MMRCAILLVNWNGWADTIECLESIIRNAPPETQVVVVDNGSTDNSLERLRGWAAGRLNARIPADGPLRSHSWPPVTKPLGCLVYSRAEAEQGGAARDDAPLVLISTGKNLGFAGGNNVGLRYLLRRRDTDFVWLLNNDTVIAPGALEALVARMQQRPDIGMCGSTLLRYHAPHKVQARGGGWYCRWIGLPWHLGQLGSADKEVDPTSIERRMSYVVGASLLVSRDFLEQVGLMCEDYFLYFEETDWALRARGRYTLAYAAASVVYHKVGGSIGTATLPWRKSALSDYYNVRNRILFTRRHYPGALPAIYLTLCLAMLLRMLYGQWGRAAMIWKLLGGRDPGASVTDTVCG